MQRSDEVVLVAVFIVIKKTTTRTEHYGIAVFHSFTVNASENGDLNRGCESVRVECLE